MTHIIGALEHIIGTLLDRRDRSSSAKGSGTYGKAESGGNEEADVGFGCGRLIFS